MSCNLREAVVVLIAAVTISMAVVAAIHKSGVLIALTILAAALVIKAKSC